jgi:hypothetical protein
MGSRRTNTDVVFVGMRAMLAVGRGGERASESDHEFHVERDVICPRCLRWIEPTDFVRQTRFGIVQHESCEWVADERCG